MIQTPKIHNGIYPKKNEALQLEGFFYSFLIATLFVMVFGTKTHAKSSVVFKKSTNQSPGAQLQLVLEEEKVYNFDGHLDILFSREKICKQNAVLTLPCLAK